MPFYQVLLKGRNRTECLLKALILGDHVSYRLARIRGVDPIEVKPIVSLKKEMENNMKAGVKQRVPDL
ncbi:MAG: SIS domain-containing protein [Candidatus Methanomethylophilaceae archaeon]